MRVLLAPQEFKGSLTALEAISAIGIGIERVLPHADLDRLPLADGGPGTVNAIVIGLGGRYALSSVDGPLGEPVSARWALIDDGRTAVIEMAAASGLHLIPPGHFDARRASSSGTGELIRAAIAAGVNRILVGIGGSATNDGGAGMAAALGVRFLDDDDRPLPPGGSALARLARLDDSALDPRLDAVEVVALADVRNTLCGPDGASAVYGPQKGADLAAVTELDWALDNYAAVVERDRGVAVRDLPGAGAGGGLVAGLVAFAGARIESGVQRIAGALDLPTHVSKAQLVITGEGRLDRQSTFGKTVAGVAAAAAQAGVPCLAVAGTIGDEDAVRSMLGLTDFEAASPPDIPLAEALQRAPQLVADATERILGRYAPAETDA